MRGPFVKMVGRTIVQSSQLPTDDTFLHVLVGVDAPEEEAEGGVVQNSTAAAAVARSEAGDAATKPSIWCYEKWGKASRRKSYTRKGKDLAERV